VACEGRTVRKGERFVPKEIAQKGQPGGGFLTRKIFTTRSELGSVFVLGHLYNLQGRSLKMERIENLRVMSFMALRVAIVAETLRWSWYCSV